METEGDDAKHECEGDEQEDSPHAAGAGVKEGSGVIQLGPVWIGKVVKVMKVMENMPGMARRWRVSGWVVSGLVCDLGGGCA